MATVKLVPWTIRFRQTQASIQIGGFRHLVLQVLILSHDLCQDLWLLFHESSFPTGFVLLCHSAQLDECGTQLLQGTSALIEAFGQPSEGKEH